MATWTGSGLLLVGHGSNRWKSGQDVTIRLAEAIKKQGLFDEVVPCFCKVEPFASLKLISSQRVYVVPNFAGVGRFTRSILPEALGITGPLTTVDGRNIIYCEPVGCHPAIPYLLCKRALALCRQQHLKPSSVALLVVGHGSRTGQASQTPLQVAASIARASIFAEVVPVFIEQEPNVRRWPELVLASHVLVAPLLISEGSHAREDLPPLFGLAGVGAGQISGRNTWLMPGIGSDPDVIAMILDQVRESDRLLTSLDALAPPG